MASHRHAGAGTHIVLVFVRGAVVERNDRNAPRQRFEGDVANGFGEAREEEQIAAGVVASEVFAALHAGEGDV